VLSSGTALAADTFKKLSRAVVALLALVAPVLTLVALPRPARGAEVTRVVSALGGDNRFDFNLTASWLHDVKSAYVKRELESGRAADTEIIKDLKFGQTRDILNLRADFGILWDVGFHVELPLVLRDASSLDFDRSDANCTYPETPGVTVPSCVDSHNSTILRDGILPGYNQDSWGMDAQHGGRPYTRAAGTYPGPSGAFLGPSRKGFQYLGVGITWAPFNQLRDDTKPTWTLSFDAKLDVFKDRRFDPDSPGGNTAVGEGFHQFVWSTFVSKRFRWFEPYFGAWYMLPARTNGSPFQNYGPTQTSVNPQQQGGVTIGLEQIAWENPRGDQRVTVEARAYVEEHFFGRGRSEIWEPLSGRSSCNVNTANDPAICRPGIDLDVNNDGVIDTPHPGITDIDAYGSVGGDVGLNVQVGKFIRFRGLFGLKTDMPHFITAAGAGVDANGDGRVNPGPVQQGETVEANPVYRQAIDLPGRRFRVEGTKIWTLFLQGSMMF
jgi:hypothetical protein